MQFPPLPGEADHGAPAPPGHDPVVKRRPLSGLKPTAEDDPRLLEVQVARIDAFSALGRQADAARLRGAIEPRQRASRSPYAADLRARLPRT